jgi:REP element-mobilizing transposase RayT
MKQEKFEPGFIYHVFNRGNNLENIFKEVKNYYFFLSLLEKHVLPIADIYAYCLLRNHFHLVLRIKDSELLPDKFKLKPFLAFSHMFNSYTKAINKAYNRKGSLFQEHLHRIKIEDEKYLIQLIIYVHLNPIKHKFTHDFKSYPYSSYLSYTSSKPSIINSNYIMSLFDDKNNFEYCHHAKRLNFDVGENDI